MTEPPRPPGEDPTTPMNPYQSNDPAPGSVPPAPSYGAPQPPTYGSPQPPTYGTPQQPPAPDNGGYAPPPTSGAGGYAPPPTSGAGGYGPPPQQPYGQQQYGQQQPYGQQPGYGAGGPISADEEKTWIMVSHFGGAALAFISGGWAGWIAPLIAMLAKGNQSPRVRQQAVAALNFQVLWAVVALVITILSTCLSAIIIGVFGFFLLIVPWAMGSIFGLIAGIKATNNEPYSYPASPNWIK